jgi:hypothetical protein
MRTCVECGVVFRPPSTRGTYKLCSPKCKAERARAMSMEREASKRPASHHFGYDIGKPIFEAPFRPRTLLRDPEGYPAQAFAEMGRRGYE